MDSQLPPDETVASAINIRSSALIILTIITVIVFLEWGQSLFAPIVLGMLLSYALYPIVSFMHKFWVPYWAGAALVVVTLVTATFYTVGSLQEQAVVLLDKVPAAVKKFSTVVNKTEEEGPTVVDKLRSAAKEVEKVTDDAGMSPAEPGVTRVKMEEKAFDLEEYLLGGSMSALVLISQFLSVLLLVYFILASGRLYKQKLVSISGDSLSEKKLTVEILEEINRQLRLFFFVMLIGALFVGVATWLAFWWLGVEQAALWGALAGIASIIPYVGPGIIFVATGFVSFVQFGAVGTALLVAVVSLVITSIQGNLLTPMMTSRAASMNPVVIFLGLLFWGWLWGPVGLIVATPIQLIVKSVCDHVENLENFGELLGN